MFRKKSMLLRGTLNTLGIERKTPAIYSKSNEGPFAGWSGSQTQSLWLLQTVKSIIKVQKAEEAEKMLISISTLLIMLQVEEGFRSSILSVS